MINKASIKINYHKTINSTELKNIINNISNKNKQLLFKYMNFIKILATKTKFNINFESIESFLTYNNFEEKVINGFKSFFLPDMPNNFTQKISTINEIINTSDNSHYNDVINIIENNFTIEFIDKAYYKYLFIAIDGNLSKQIFNGIKISNLEYLRTNFRDATLKHAQFSKIIFDNAIFINTILNHSSLSEVTINNSNLNYIDLTNARCYKLKISNLEILEGNFSETHFNEIFFTNLTLIECHGNIQDINNSILENVKLESCYYNYNTYNYTIFTNCTFISTEFSGSQFNNCIFENCIFTNCNFSQALFNNTTLKNSNFINTDFKEANFYDSAITIILPNIDNTFLDNYMNVFSSINSIDNKYLEIKNNLLIKLLEFISTKKHMYYYTDILIKLEQYIYAEPKYLENSIINEFIMHSLIPNKIKQGQISPIKFHQTEMKIIFSFLKSNYKKYSKYNSFLNQLLFHARNHNNNSLSKFILKKIKLDINIFNFIKNYVDDDENMYYFFKKKFKHSGKTIYLNVSHVYLQKFLYGEHMNIRRDNIYYLINNKMQPNGKINFSNIFTKYFKIFDKYYTFEINNSLYIKLINLLFNQCVIESKFLDIMHKTCTINNKFTSWTSEERDSLLQIINEITINTYSNDITITNEHFTNIINTLQINSCNIHEIFQYLFVFSIIIIKCSSKSFFGNENDSPYPLRAYALAIINKCKNLNIEISTEIFPPSNTEWTSFLINYHHKNPSLNCSDSIADTWLLYCKNNFNDAYKALVPTTWQ